MPANVRRAGHAIGPFWRFWKQRGVSRRNAKSKRARILAALRRESERDLIALIRRRLALPVEKRLHFLRVRLPGGGAHL